LSPKEQYEFKNNHEYKIAYRCVLDRGGIDVELACPSCGNISWVYKNKTGTGDLPKDQMKWKCSECGQWFICNRKQVTKILNL